MENHLLSKEGGDYSTHWYQKTLRFYYGFNNSFLTQILLMREKLNASDLDESMGSIPTPRIWKAIGDELLYECDIKNEYELLHLVNCFRLSLQEYNANSGIYDPKSRHQHGVKGTVWMGIFPVINEVVFIRPNFRDMVGDMFSSEESWTLDQINLSYEHEKVGTVRADYIGPNIDIGFRMKDFASQRKLVLTGIVSYALASAMYDLKNEDSNNTSDTSIMFFEGMVLLRGVSNSMSFPLFWIDISQNSPYMEKQSYDRLLDDLEHRQSVSPEKALGFLQTYFQSKHSEVFHPIIPGSRKFGAMPDQYQKLLDIQRTRYAREIERSRRMQETFREQKGEADLKTDNNARQALYASRLDSHANMKIQNLLDQLIPDMTARQPKANEPALSLVEKGQNPGPDAKRSATS